MILEVAILDIKIGSEKDFVESFRLAEKIISSIDGYLSHQLQVCIEKPNRYILLVNWKTLESHTHGFRKSKEYQEWKRLLHHFYDPFPVVEHYNLLSADSQKDSDLVEFIKNAFGNGLTYLEAVQLCLRLFCTTEKIPQKFHLLCNKEGLAQVFSQLYREGVIIGETSLSAIYGANHHSCADKGHWIEVIASIFKMNIEYDGALADKLVYKLKKANFSDNV